MAVMALLTALALAAGSPVSLARESRPSPSAVFGAERVDAAEAPDASMEAYLAPFREGVEAYSREVIGMAAEFLSPRTKPENGVSNLVADALRVMGAETFGEPVDIAMSNFGGLRRNLDAGPITVGLITELSPFENFLVLLEMEGRQVLELARGIAERGGRPLSGMELVIGPHNELRRARVGGQPIEPDRIYKVVTIDYLYNVETATFPRDRILSMTMSGLRQRDAIIEYMKRLHERGVALRNAGDGRVRKEEK